MPVCGLPPLYRPFCRRRYALPAATAFVNVFFLPRTAAPHPHPTRLPHTRDSSGGDYYRYLLVHAVVPLPGRTCAHTPPREYQPLDLLDTSEP